MLVSDSHGKERVGVITVVRQGIDGVIYSGDPPKKKMVVMVAAW